MKLFTCARTPFLAAIAWLAVSVVTYAQTSTGMRYASSRANQSRLTADSSPPAAVSEALGLESSTVEDLSLAPMGDWDGGSGDCGGCGGCLDGCCGPNRHGMWYGGVDYLLMRPRLSQGVAENRRTLVTTSQGTAAPTTSNLVDQSIAFPFDYNSGFRASAGYRLLDCGGDFQVTYWRMTNSAQVHDGPSDVTGGIAILSGVLENNTQNDNEFYSASTSITANIFDIDFAKCLSMGGPRNPCDACFCPRWDLRWNAGARVADITRTNGNLVTNEFGGAVSYGNVNARFTGAGPRVGVQGRRYFGHTGMLSVFARANQALLIGDYRMTRQKVTPGSELISNDIETQIDRYSRMVPVTDIEVGGSWQIAPYTFVSVGYFFQCWWDLGQSETISGTNFGALDTANILGFDGLFVRGEMLF